MPRCRHEFPLFMIVGGALCLCSVQAIGRTHIHTALARHPSPVSDTSGDPGRISGIRFWSQPDATRIAIEVTSDFKLRSDRLQNPDRLFFDVAGVKPADGHRGIQTINVGDTFVKQIRVAETQPGTTRIVLDLRAPVDFNASQLSNPERLIIELRAAGVKNESVPLVQPAVTLARKQFQPPSNPSALETPLVTPRIEPPPGITAHMDSAPLPLTAKLAPPPAAQKESYRQPLTTASFSRSTPVSSPPLAAKKTASGEASLTRVLGLKLGKVVIDAGHGGHDSGTCGPGGLLEKDLVLDIARRLGRLVEARLGSEVVYTRSDDNFIPLEERTRIANDNKADLFLSIHANSSPVRSISGVETYYLNFTSSKTALDVAARENASSERSIYELKDLLQKIALKDKLDESREFAAKVQTALSALSSKNNAHSKDRGVKKAPFVVLIGASMPSILAEVGFVTNPHDESLMKRPEYRQRIAEALYRGIAQYASGLSHFQVAQRKSAAE
jgi:N-acetylmuramoyl-L-alanine amidase